MPRENAKLKPFVSGKLEKRTIFVSIDGTLQNAFEHPITVQTRSFHSIRFQSICSIVLAIIHR